MWKPLHPPYFLSFAAQRNELYCIGVTNFQGYWIINSSRKSFLADLKESNDDLEFDDETELLQRGLDMVGNPEQLQKVNIEQEDNGKYLSVSISKKHEITLKLELRLVEASSEQFFDAITQPLLKTVCDLRSSQQELRELLLKKDKEIEEYKLEGKAPRRLITTLYDDAAHMVKHTAYEQYFNAPRVPELLEATSLCSSTTRKRPVLPEIENTAKTEIKNCSQDNVIDAVVPAQIDDTKIQTVEVLKKRKQTKKLNY